MADRTDSTTPPVYGAKSRRRVLVVEDDTDAREMVRLALSLEGYEVYDAADGPTGLDMARKLAPEVAVLDIGLPGLDGFELARRLRAQEGGAPVAVASRTASMVLIALTGYGRAADRQRAREVGFDAHLLKPTHPRELIHTIEQLCQARRGRTPTS